MADPSSPPTPRWLKVFGVAVLVLVVLAGFLHLSGIVPDHHGAPPAQAGTPP